MTEQGLPDPWESPDAFEEVIEQYRAIGIDDFVIDQPRPDQQRTLERIAADTIPRLRQTGSVSV